MSAANMQAAVIARRRSEAVTRNLSPEMRAQIISDSMGMLPHDQRKKAVYAAALEHIRAAIAVAVNAATQGYEPASFGD